MTDELRAFWDFDGLAATERKFRERLVAGTPDHAEVLTQLARVHGLSGRLAAGQ